MTLSPGSRLGPHEILAPIGAGGMGWLTLGPETTYLSGIGRSLLSRDGRSYAFNPHGVQDSSLFVVEGLH